MMSAPTGAVLLKARIRHSRWFVILLVALIFISATHLSQNVMAVRGMQWSGYALVLLGVFIRIYSSLYIGGRKNDELVTDGPFSVVRNPLYVGSFIAMVGIGLQSTSVVILLLLVAAFLLYYPLVIRREEGFLLEKFGESYTRYVQSTPRAIPNMRLWRSPETVSCKPEFVLRTMRDGAVFFLPLPVFDCLINLHANGTLPVYLTLI